MQNLSDVPINMSVCIELFKDEEGFFQQTSGSDYSFLMMHDQDRQKLIQR